MRQGGTWIPHLSHFGHGGCGGGCYPNIRRLTPQCWWLKRFCRPFQVRKDPRHPEKGNFHCAVPFGKLTSNTCWMCSIWLNGSRFQLISSSVTCIRRLCPVIKPAVSSNPQSGKGVHIIIWSRYVAPLLVHRNHTASSDIPYRSVPGWKVMALDFVKFATSPFQRKRQMKMFSAPCIHSGSRYPTTLLSAYNNPIHLPTASTNPLCVTSWSSPGIAI